jgi:hypothetical protein
MSSRFPGVGVEARVTDPPRVLADWIVAACTKDGEEAGTLDKPA